MSQSHHRLGFVVAPSAVRPSAGASRTGAASGGCCGATSETARVGREPAPCAPPGASGAVPEPLATEDELLLVGDLGRATGKTVRALRLYEDLGLLAPHERSGPGRYRLFARDAISRVQWISKLQSLGLPLSEIQQVVREQESAVSAQLAADRLRAVYTEKLAETRAKLEELRVLEFELEASLRFLDLCHASCEPAAEAAACGCCGRHAATAHAPALVAGVRPQ